MTESGTQDLIGYSADFIEGKIEVRLTVEDKHLNRAETLHGGIMATLLDVACGYEANLVPKPDKDTFMVTVSLTTNFIAAGKKGDDLLASATTVGGGRSVKYVQGALCNQDGKVIATASGIFRKTG